MAMEMDVQMIADVVHGVEREKLVQTCSLFWMLLVILGFCSFKRIHYAVWLICCIMRLGSGLFSFCCAFIVCTI